MPHWTVHSSTCVVLLVAIASATPREGNITIHITGPVKIIMGSPGESSTPGGYEVPSVGQCAEEDGFCVATGDQCNGTMKILHNSCNDHCTCCVPDKQAGCPEGFFMSNGSTQCFKYFNEDRTWEEAKSTCVSEGLHLAEPTNDVAIALRKDLRDMYGVVGLIWLGARGDGRYMRWVRGGAAIPDSNPLWSPEPRKAVLGHSDLISINRVSWAEEISNDIDSRYCLLLVVSKKRRKEKHNAVYAFGYCLSRYYRKTLCELVKE